MEKFFREEIEGQELENNIDFILDLYSETNEGGLDIGFLNIFKSLNVDSLKIEDTEYYIKIIKQRLKTYLKNKTYIDQLLKDKNIKEDNEYAELFLEFINFLDYFDEYSKILNGENKSKLIQSLDYIKKEFSRNSNI